MSWRLATARRLLSHSSLKRRRKARHRDRVFAGRVGRYRGVRVHGAIVQPRGQHEFGVQGLIPSDVLARLGGHTAENADKRGVAVLSQVDGARWLSLEGKASVQTGLEPVRDAELRYAQRYRTPRPNPKRVVIEVRIERVLGSLDLLDRASDQA